MAKVGISLGLTFRIGPENTNQYAKINLEVSDIDTEAPIPPQLEQTNDAVNQVWDYVYKKMDDEMTERIMEA